MTFFVKHPSAKGHFALTLQLHVLVVVVSSPLSMFLLCALILLKYFKLILDKLLVHAELAK